MPTPPLPPSLQLLKLACDRFGYTWKVVDTYSNSLIEVSDGKKSFFSTNQSSNYPLNLRFAARVAKDKAWAYEIMRQKGVKVPVGDYFFVREDHRELRGDGREIPDALKYAEKIGYPVFVKPNGSSLGILAEKIYTTDQLARHLTEISDISYIAHVQECVPDPEYRIFVLDGEIQYVYRREPLVVVGDGTKTVSDFVAETNAQIYRERNKIPPHSPFLLEELKNLGLKYDSVLPKGQKLSLMSKANVSAGGEIADYRTEVSEATMEWARKVADIFSLRVCGIDVFVNGSVDDPAGFTVIEVNQNPNLTGIFDMGEEEKALGIWGKILRGYFNE